MWKIIRTKSDAEPWWFLEGWEEDIDETWTFTDRTEALAFYQTLIRDLKSAYPHHRVKRETQWAFWNEDEIYFCESCDDDLQLFHGLLLYYEDEPYTEPV